MRIGAIGRGNAARQAYTAKLVCIGRNRSEIFFAQLIDIALRACDKLIINKEENKKGELPMINRQSNNIIPVIHRLVTDEYGENYWFNGSAKYVMECMGETDYDYWFFAGITGDVFTQHYNRLRYAGDALTSYRMERNMGGNPTAFTECIFGKCGYAATYVSIEDLRKNPAMYLSTLIAYIGKGVPVMANGAQTGVYVGYEDYGKVLLLITGNSDQPERIPFDTVLKGWTNDAWKLQGDGGWIFVGEKKESRPLAQIYREGICEIPSRLSEKTERYCLGAEAFRQWAEDIEGGRFDGTPVEMFETWTDYTNYICVLATNGSCCHGFLQRAQELNPDMGFLSEVSHLYKRTADMWNNDNGTDLEAIGGGFNITLEALQDKEKRGRITAKIREFADVTDEIAQMLEKCIAALRP